MSFIIHLLVVVDIRLLDTDEECDKSVRQQQEVEGELAPIQSGPLQQSGTDEQHLQFNIQPVTRLP